MIGLLRVLTLNTWNREGEYDRRARLIRRELAALAPDVLGFQEVLEDQVPELLAGLGYAHVWHGHGASGMAIASRWPIEQADALDLPAARNADGAPAGPPVGGIVQRAIVRAPFTALPFVNTTTYYPAPHEGWKREPQMPVLHDAVRDLQRSAGGRAAFPAVLVGDFNTEPDSTEIRFLKGLQSIAGRSAWYCDAWERAGQVADAAGTPQHSRGDGATWTRRNPASAAWGLPDRRIDFIFVAAPGVQGTGAVHDCRLAFDTPEGGVWPSDHLGVYATLATEG